MKLRISNKVCKTRKLIGNKIWWKLLHKQFGFCRPSSLFWPRGIFLAESGTVTACWRICVLSTCLQTDFLTKEGYVQLDFSITHMPKWVSRKSSKLSHFPFLFSYSFIFAVLIGGFTGSRSEVYSLPTNGPLQRLPIF